jgi:hypothetical protein
MRPTAAPRAGGHGTLSLFLAFFFGSLAMIAVDKLLKVIQRANLCC